MGTDSHADNRIDDPIDFLGKLVAAFAKTDVECIDVVNRGASPNVRIGLQSQATQHWEFFPIKVDRNSSQSEDVVEEDVQAASSHSGHH